MMEDQWDVACRLFESEDHLETHHSRLIALEDSESCVKANVRIILIVIIGY